MGTVHLPKIAENFFLLKMTIKRNAVDFIRASLLNKS